MMKTAAYQGLLAPIQFGTLQLKNRVFMAPLTRQRAGLERMPGRLHRAYYSRRITSGLMITEATQISESGIGYIGTPGIHTAEQVKAWRKVTDKVHREGGVIFVQLWHVGRVSHSSLLPDKRRPLAPSAIPAMGHVATSLGKKSFELPREMTLLDIRQTVEDYRNASKMAKEAGFDGVEIHGANAYLIDQFLHVSSNQRKDEYGGSIENRGRFLFEVLEAVLSQWENHRVSIRLSPSGLRYGMEDPDVVPLFEYVVKKLNDYPLAYLHLIEPMEPLDDFPYMIAHVAEYFRPLYQGFLVANGNISIDDGEAMIQSGVADAIAFGRLFIANPDLPLRIEYDLPLNRPDPSTFFLGGGRGYIDYPTITKQADLTH